MNKTLKEIIEANSYLTAEAVMNLADDDGITITVADLKRLELDLKTEREELNEKVVEIELQLLPLQGVPPSERDVSKIVPLITKKVELLKQIQDLQ